MSSYSPSEFENPYAPPRVLFDNVNVPPAKQEGLWRKGKVLVMHKRAPLPARCVKSNMPTDRYLKRSLYWHHPAIYLLLLMNILIYAVLALVLRKSAVIHIGLSEEWFARRRRAIAVGWSLVLGSIGMVVVAAAMMDRNENMAFLIMAAPLVFLFGAIYGLMKSRMVAALRISDDYVWLKGVHPEFLAGLPEWPNYP